MVLTPCTYSATFRVHGDDVNFTELENVLGITATHSHRGGAQRTNREAPWPDDAWHLEAEVEAASPLERHLHWLWSRLMPHAAFLKRVCEKHRVDVFCSFTSGSDISQFSIEGRCLEMFTTLNIQMTVSVIIL